ncbi:hypothetical protein Amet_3986 [Alkaliphilus metalliredigens QYMF]|uniref:Uncharacterized protein n=1 Tax=Alkaliphilus metalliredigens (strain QYMF) TaxID=293826 RepID=A6TV51_ALKMQ|nr:hypothetical protein [Alkaliphilus metalliredigens]ABR50069.1 hypothetical protein Amet_3986 [Alkaliphilus metalliredigens QYMF]
MNCFKDHIDVMLGNIFNETQIYRPTYPLNFVHSISQNDELWEKDISGSVEKEIRYLFYIYYKIHSIYEIYKCDDCFLYSRLIACEFEYFLLRVPVIFDILEKHFLESLDSTLDNLNMVIPLYNELSLIKKLRNEIVHHSAKISVLSTGNSLVFKYCLHRNKTTEFLPSTIFKDENTLGYYKLSEYSTMILCLILNYLNEFFTKSEKIRNDGKELSKKIIDEVVYFDKTTDYPYSRINIFYGELSIFRENLDGFRISCL